MIERKCDRCEIPIKDSDAWRARLQPFIANRDCSEGVSIELCSSCAIKLMEWIKAGKNND
jgi:hypothetical protein